MFGFLVKGESAPPAPPPQTEGIKISGTEVPGRIDGALWRLSGIRGVPCTCNFAVSNPAHDICRASFPLALSPIFPIILMKQKYLKIIQNNTIRLNGVDPRWPVGAPGP